VRNTTPHRCGVQRCRQLHGVGRRLRAGTASLPRGVCRASVCRASAARRPQAQREQSPRRLEGLTPLAAMGRWAVRRVQRCATSAPGLNGVREREGRRPSFGGSSTIKRGEACAHRCTTTRTRTCMHAHMHACTHEHTRARTCMHQHIRTQSLTHALTHTAHTHTHTLTHTHTHTAHTRTHAHTHPPTHTHTRIRPPHARARAYTHIHAHTQSTQSTQSTHTHTHMEV
jgi:hypothetical protein